MKHTLRDLIDEDKKECCICGKKFKGYGNNPYPIMEDGECCDECNMNVVIPARIAGLKRIRPRDSVNDLKALIDSEKEAINLYADAIGRAGEGLEHDIYIEILNDEKDHLAKLNDLLEGYTKSQQIK